MHYCRGENEFRNPAYFAADFINPKINSYQIYVHATQSYKYTYTVVSLAVFQLK